jgi:hypothetical protein
MYEETNGALEVWFGDQHLATGYHNQLKTQIQDSGEPLQEFATTIKQLTHFAFPAVHKDHVPRGTGKVFLNSIGERSTIPQLLLGGKKRLSKASRRTLELEVVKLAVGSPSGSRKQVTRYCGAAAPSQTKEETANSLHASAVGPQATFEILSPRNQKKCQPQYDVEVPFARTTADVTDMSSQRRTNGNTPPEQP